MSASWTGPPDQATVGRSQVQHSLQWIRAFLEGQRGELIRRIAVAPSSWSTTAQIVCDASPWGLGAIFVENGDIKFWLASPIGPEDEQILEATVGDSAGQAAFEALALCVAMRTWLPEWQDSRTVVIVRSDSLAALGALNRINGGTAQINKVIRECALDLAEGSYIVDLISHIPAEYNDIPDTLSRLAAPGSHGKSFPKELVNVPESRTAPRTRSWWRTLAPP